MFQRFVSSPGSLVPRPPGGVPPCWAAPQSVRWWCPRPARPLPLTPPALERHPGRFGKLINNFAPCSVVKSELWWNMYWILQDQFLRFFHSKWFQEQMVHVHRIHRGAMIHRQWAQAPKWATGTAAHQKRCPCSRGPQWQFLLGLLACWTWWKATFRFATWFSWSFNK